MEEPSFRIVAARQSLFSEVRALSGQLAEPQKFLSQLQTAGIIQVENLDGSAPRRGQALKICAPERKVGKPLVAPRVKQDLHATRQGVDSTQVGTLVKVAAVASQREIVDIVEPAVLPGNHVLDMM
jgi:hypothetical protein